MYPTSFQKKICWAAITALAMVALVGVVILIGWGAVKAIGILKPLIVPIAIAGIMAYLLEPVVQFLCRRKIHRIWSVLMVFCALVAVIALILVWVVPAGYRQIHQFTQQLPEYSIRTQQLMSKTLDWSRSIPDMPLIHRFMSQSNETADPVTAYTTKMVQDAVRWLEAKMPDVAGGIWNFVVNNFLYQGVNRVFGVLEFFVGIVLIPVFLFFFLAEGSNISSRWSDYVPLHNSPLKREVVSLLDEINHYLISFFRGQLLVSMIDGAILTIALLIVGVDFAVLMGLAVGVLGLIPYAGVFIVWIPTVLITIFQFGDWAHPAWVTFIFLLVYKIDGFFISPRIVGGSVGLHPLTVIISVLAWSLMLGGLLGALLAVPLTATIKVVLKRYFWDRMPQQPAHK
ncbi:MAG: AI-2E family transporter [Chthoniobacterales bacterium]